MSYVLKLGKHFIVATLNYTDSELIRLTEKFTLEDWNKIRTDAHWLARDSMSYQNIKNAFLLKEVYKYLSMDDYL